ncbi:hypothetical protein FACS1894130_12460 [Spirochaetia bacterium]|nr:hypothetical protein FACS1894130_12460 [Spirochaetia bacterium]
MPQVEISAPLSVLDDLGRPVNFGWARTQLFEYNSQLIRGPVRRITAQDRYILLSPTHLITLEVLDDGYLGYIGVSIISLKDKKRSTQTYTLPFPLGGLEMPDRSDRSAVRFKRNKRLIEFTAMEGGARIIRVDFPKFGHHRSLRGEVVLSPLPDAESLVTHQPWPREKDSFALCRRSPWYIAEGVMQFGTSELIFTQGNGWGIFDWSRGCRSRSDTRFWATACGMADEDRIGFSVGYGATDAGLGTENAFFLNGRLHKLDQVTFHINPASWMERWCFSSNDNRLEMTFVPLQERVERTQMLFHSRRRRQVFGSFGGRVVLDDGRPLEFRDLTGFAERSKTTN